MQRLHSALIAAATAHRKQSRQAFQKLDLSDGQPKVLSILVQSDGCLQKDLAALCRVEPATMTVLLRNMMNKDLIRKVPVHAASGKHAYGIYLTEFGREQAKRVESTICEIEDIALRGFTDDEKEMILSLLWRVTQNLSE